MTDKEKIKNIKSLSDKMYTAMQNLTTDTTSIRKAMYEYHQFIITKFHEEEPVSDDLEEEQMNKKHLWKDAQGDDLPEIDRDVIALQGRKVVFAHRPNPQGWNDKNISTGKVTHYTPKTYGKGGWNIPDAKYWLDAPLPDVENMKE